jgi:hypothetical protein
MEIRGYMIGACFLIFLLRFALQIAGSLLIVTLVAGCLYGCAHAAPASVPIVARADKFGLRKPMALLLRRRYVEEIESREARP